MSLSRRTLLCAIPAGAALSQGPAFAQSASPGAAAPSASTTPAAPTPAPNQQAPGYYRYKVGELEVTAINDGVWSRPLDPGFVRNVAPEEVKKAQEAAFLPTDITPIPFTTSVVKAGGKVIVVDTGTGNMGPPGTGSWMANFKAAGFDPAKVDSIIISHIHGDHINGLRLRDGAAVFPSSEIMISEPEWAYWMDDAKMAAAPEGLKGNFNNVSRVFGPIAKDVKRFEDGKEIAPGITAVAAPGHTPGHFAFILASGTSKVMLMSDTSNHPALFVRHPEWQASFDMDGSQAVQTRRKLLDMAAAEKARVAFYHAPFPATGYIAKTGDGREYVPVQSSSKL